MRFGSGQSVLALAAFAALGAPAFGGSDLYFVTYSHHIHKGELEAMFMTDVTRPAERTQDVGNYTSQMLELEYAPTGRWSSELMLESFYDTSYGTGRFTGFRWENRWRVFSEENRGLNPVLYVEYEHLHASTRYKMELSGREDGRGEPEGLEGKPERILESRLVLSRDLGPYNVSFNWINETDLRRGAFGFTDFGYALGAHRTFGGTHDHGEGHHESRAFWKPAAAGVELYGGLGNNRAFGGRFSVQQHYLQPVVMFHLPRGVMFHVGAAIGLTPVSDNLLRTAVGFEF